MTNLYSRVRELPKRIERAKVRIADIERGIAFEGTTTRTYDWRALANAKRRLAALENEARQYHFFDLLK